MTEQEIQAEALRLQVEHNELKPYFDAVCNKRDWKSPIDAFCRRDDLPRVKRAIAFFTATDAIHQEVMPPNSEWVRVLSIGYRQGPAGDH